MTDQSTSSLFHVGMEPRITPAARRGTYPLDPSWAFPGYTRDEVERTALAALTSDPVGFEPITYYVSGPMAGHDGHNFPFFERCKNHLLNEGMRVLSPHEIDHGDGELSNEDYLRNDLIYMMQWCRGIVMVGNWLDSWGAGFELNVAAKLQFHILLFNYENGSLHDGEGLRKYVH